MVHRVLYGGSLLRRRFRPQILDANAEQGRFKAHGQRISKLQTLSRQHNQRTQGPGTEWSWLDACVGQKAKVKGK